MARVQLRAGRVPDVCSETDADSESADKPAVAEPKCTSKDPVTGDCISYSPADDSDRPYGEPYLDKAKYEECAAAASSDGERELICGNGPKP